MMSHFKVSLRVTEAKVGALLRWIAEHDAEVTEPLRWDDDSRPASSQANSSSPRAPQRPRSAVACHERILTVMMTNPSRTWTRQELLRRVGASGLDQALSVLVRSGDIVRVGSGRYRIGVTNRTVGTPQPQFAGITPNSHHDHIFRYLLRHHPRRPATAEITKYLIQASGSPNPATSARLGEMRDRKGLVNYRDGDGTWGLTPAALNEAPRAMPVEIEVPAGGDGAARAESRE
jgi:hypothetical protein